MNIENNEETNLKSIEIYKKPYASATPGPCMLHEHAGEPSILEMVERGGELFYIKQ